MRLDGKAGIVVGGGQTPGDTYGNGRAAAVLFAREGAKVLVVDRDASSAEETAALIRNDGGSATVFRADWTLADDCERFADACLNAWGQIDFLQNNVGVFSGDAELGLITEAAYQRIMDVNLKGCLLSCRAVFPRMQRQERGSIVNVSSFAAIGGTKTLAYKMSKAGMNALSQSLAVAGAPFGVRVNAVAPGLMNTPMAIEGRGVAGEQKDRLRAERDEKVPLRGKMGTAWDTAYASLFLHSDEANFITGVVLPVDGGQSARRG
jgi:NAD(P)-dependent dehydrogenase (short-subunit alcohol dehydrogenase family)